MSMATIKHIRWLNNLNEPMEKILREADPEGLIKMGCPPDEYNGEARRITIGLLLEQPRSAEDIFHVVWPIFKHWIGYDKENKRTMRARARYLKLSELIFKKLKVRSVTNTFKR
jgi:hypothetical protein